MMSTADQRDVREKLRGMIAPAVTPFDGEEIRWDLFRADIRRLLDAGVDGIGVAGSTGEGPVLSDGEIGRCVAEARTEAGDKLPIVAGVIRNSTNEALSAAHAAVDAGADALLVTPVFYFGATADDNYRYYETIARAVRLPIIVYNVVATNQIGAATMRRLSQIESVIGVKQVGAEALTQMVAHCGDRVLVYSACDAMLYSTYVAGSIGAISALITVAPELCVRQWRAYLAGDQGIAMQLQRVLAPIALAYAERPFPAKVKALINLQGRKVGTTRSPLGTVSQAEETQLIEILRTAGLL